MLSTLRNILRVASFGAFADSYPVYVAAKRVYRLIHPGTQITEPLCFDGVALQIEGFCHSGNTFLRNNVASEDRGRVITHTHRQWSMATGLRHHIPIGLLIRDPRQVAASMYYRSDKDGTAVAYWAGLASWILYYRYAWPYRHQMQILPFEHLTNDYDTIAMQLESYSQVHFLHPPQLENLNAFTGPRPTLCPNALERWLERRAMALYQRYVTFAKQQQASATLAHANSRPLTEAAAIMSTDHGGVGPQARA